jgi:hypothetical protein
VIADAPPVMVCVVVRTCFKSIYTLEFPAIAVVVFNAVLEPAVPIPKVKVPAVDVVFVTTILETIVVVDAGTV